MLHRIRAMPTFLEFFCGGGMVRAGLGLPGQPLQFHDHPVAQAMAHQLIARAADLHLECNGVHVVAVRVQAFLQCLHDVSLRGQAGLGQRLAQHGRLLGAGPPDRRCFLRPEQQGQAIVRPGDHQRNGARSQSDNAVVAEPVAKDDGIEWGRCGRRLVDGRLDLDEARLRR